MEIIETLQRSRPEIVHIFDEIVRTLPEGVYLTYLKQSGMRIEMRGIAQSSTRVSAFMRNIDGSEWLADPALQIVETKDPTRAAAPSSPCSRTSVARYRRRKRRMARRWRPNEQAEGTAGPAAQPRPERPGPLALRRAIGTVVLVFALAASAGYWYFVWKAKRPELLEARAKETELWSTLETKARKAANLQAYKDQLAEMEKSFGAMLRQLPNRTEVPNLLVDISQTAWPRARGEALSAAGRDPQGLLRRAADQHPAHRRLPRDGQLRRRHRCAAAHRHAARHRDHAASQGRCGRRRSRAQRHREDLPLSGRRGAGRERARDGQEAGKKAKKPRAAPEAGNGRGHVHHE